MAGKTWNFANVRPNCCQYCRRVLSFDVR